jgi:Lipopolysaccharide kinase (Kdo/WaaP) family
VDQQEPLHLAVPMAQEQLAPDDFIEWKQGLLEELARLCRELHRRHYYHKDLYFCHFYVHADDLSRVPTTWENRITMIDFHRLQKHRFARPWHLVKDLAQLLYSSNVPGINETDRQIFWKQYRSGDWGTTKPPAEWLLRFIRWKAGRYQAHHDRKQTRRGALQTVTS